MSIQKPNFKINQKKPQSAIIVSEDQSNLKMETNLVFKDRYEFLDEFEKDFGDEVSKIKNVFQNQLEEEHFSDINEFLDKSYITNE